MTMWYSPAADSSDINESRISWQLEYKALDEWGLDFVHLLAGGGGEAALTGSPLGPCLYPFITGGYKKKK